MLIRPVAKRFDSDEELTQPVEIGTKYGELTQVRNTMYIKHARDASNYYQGKNVFDVILVSEMIVKVKDVNDFEPGGIEYHDLFEETIKNGKSMNYFVKEVHFFNGIGTDMDPNHSIVDKLKSMTLYPLLSYSIGENEYHILPQSKVLFYKHGSGLLSNVIYTYSYSYDLLKLNSPKVSFNKNNIQYVLGKMNAVGCFFDITDPRYPDAVPYSNHMTHVRNMRSQYSGQDLLSSLVNLSVKEIVNDVEAEELQQEKYNEQLRKELMSEDADSVDTRAITRIAIRMVLRNLIVDYMKISICSMMEKLEIIYDSFDDDKTCLKRITVPFDKLPAVFTTVKLQFIVNEFKRLCENIIKDDSNLFGEHVRITLCDLPNEVVVKFTDFGENKIRPHTMFKNIVSETFKLNKSEAILDYVNEGIHNNHSPSSTSVVNTNLYLLNAK